MNDILLEEEINTKAQTKFKFNCGDLRIRDNVSFLKDLDICSELLFKKKILSRHD